PFVMPGGRAILFTSFTAGGDNAPHIEALTIADGKRHTIAEHAQFPIYLPTGHLLFLRDSALLAVPFDLDRLHPSGEAVRVVENVSVSGSGAPIAAVSASGTLVYAPAEATAGRLVLVSRQGAEVTISDVPRNYLAPRLSPDGRRIVVVSGNALWIQD